MNIEIISILLKKFINNKNKFMKKNFALLDNLEENLQAINDIDDSVKITLGPTGKNGILTIFDT